MDREQYMIDLQRALNNCFSQKQSDDVLADYAEFFDAGIAEGKGESELCAEFGSPKNVVLALKKEKTLHQRFHLSAKLIVILLCIATLFLFACARSSFLYFPNICLFECSLLALSLFMQLIVFMGDTRSLNLSNSRSFPKLRWMKITLAACWPVLVAVYIFLVLYNNYLDHLPNPSAQLINLSLDFAIISFLILFGAVTIFTAIYIMKAKKYAWLKVGMFIGYPCVIFLLSCLIVATINTLNHNYQSSSFDLFFLSRYSTNILYVLIIILSFMLIAYAIHVNLKVKWLLFLNTALFGLATIVNETLPVIHRPFLNWNHISQVVFNSFFLSFCPPAIAAILFLLFLQRNLKTKGMKRFERADEKGNS